MTPSRNQNPLSSVLTRYLQTLRRHQAVWLIPASIVTAIGVTYAIVRPDTWMATQSLVVRDEAVGQLSHHGRFDTTDSRKAAQELITQIAQNRSVLTGTLREVGPPDSEKAKNWPTERNIEELQEAIVISAPDGAELGQTDVLYLRVKSREAERAIRLSKSLYRHLKQRLMILRNRQADSIVRELQEKQKLTQQHLAEAISRLEEMEKEVGADLGELRTMNQSGSGDSNLRLSASQILNQLRAREASRAASQQTLELLRSARQNPDTLVATPNELLQSQPALQRLKDGLIDAQLKLSELLGTMNQQHPAVQSAIAAESEIRRHLYEEVNNAIRGVRAELSVSDALIRAHRRQLAEVQSRLETLASLRARYDLLVAEVEHRSQQVRQGEIALSDAQASRNAAIATSLISAIDTPSVGDSPLGPGRLTIVLASGLCGLTIGLGILCLVLPDEGGKSMGRRWSDRLMIGRRASDRVSVPSSANPNPNRRKTDFVTSQSAAAEAGTTPTAENEQAEALIH